MKIAVSSSGKDLDAQIDPRFGRCAYFLIVDPETMTVEAHDNENIALGGGAGIQSAQFVASMGAETVITGNCGPNAVRTLAAAGIDIILEQSGTVRKAVEAYGRGELSPSTQPNVTDHYGMARGGRRGMGMGGGRCRRDPSFRPGFGSAPEEAGSGQRPAQDDEALLKGMKARAEGLMREIEALEARIRSAKSK